MSFEVPGFQLGVLEASADLSAKQFYCAKINSSGKVALCDTAGEKVDGVIQNKPASGTAVTLAKEGVFKAIVAGTVTAGDLLEVTSAGKLQTATKKILTATATLDFPSAATLVGADLTITVTGAAVGDAVLVGTPAAPTASLGYFGYVSATDTVTVRQLNASTGTIDSASGTFRATVIKAQTYIVGRALESATADLNVIAVDLSFLGQPSV